MINKDNQRNLFGKTQKDTQTGSEKRKKKEEKKTQIKKIGKVPKPDPKISIHNDWWVRDLFSFLDKQRR